MYVCICGCTYICIHTHIYTYIYTYSYVYVCVKLIGRWGKNIWRGNSLELSLGHRDEPFELWSVWWVYMCKHVCICLVWVSVMSMNFTSIQLNTTRCRFRLPVLQPSSRQPSHLLKHNVYTWVRELEWRVNRGQPFSRTNVLQTKPASQVLFSFIVCPELAVLVREKGKKGILSLEVTNCILWNNCSHDFREGELNGEKIIPLEKGMWCLSHHHATLVYCFAVVCISETVFFFLRECIETELFVPHKKTL